MEKEWIEIKDDKCEEWFDLEILNDKINEYLKINVDLNGALLSMQKIGHISNYEMKEGMGFGDRIFTDRAGVVWQCCLFNGEAWARVAPTKYQK